MGNPRPTRNPRRGRHIGRTWAYIIGDAEAGRKKLEAEERTGAVMENGRLGDALGASETTKKK